MTALLYCVAALLILAGAAAGLYGADNIRAESGSAWLQTGGALFAIGFVVLGLASAVRELKRIRRALTEISDEPETAAPQTRLPEPPAVAPAVVAAEVAPEPDRDAERSGDKGEAPEPKAPVVAPAVERIGTATRSDAGAHGLSPERDAPPPPEQRRHEPEPEAEPEHEPEPEPVPAAPPAPPTVVATYTSGGVNYFMYSNGCIEAELEKGRYRFNSMAELRTYVETGEGGTLIAPASGSPAPAATSAAS